MADIVPFLGIRYDAERAGDMSRVLAPPYDVIGEAERAELEARHPQNVVRIELPRGAGDARYDEAARLLGTWKSEGILRADARPAFYVHEQGTATVEDCDLRGNKLGAWDLGPGCHVRRSNNDE